MPGLLTRPIPGSPTTKPSRGTLDVTSPYAVGLVACVPFWEGQGSPRDIVSPTRFSLAEPYAWTLGGSAAWQIGRGGWGVHFTGGVSDLLTGPTFSAGTVPPVDTTLLVVFSLDSNPATGAMLLGYADAGAANFAPILGITSSGAIRMYSFSGGAQFQDGPTITLAPALHVAVGTVKSSGPTGTGLRVYLDGAIGGAQTFGASSTITNPILYISKSVGAFTSRLTGTVFFLAAWQRALSRNEVLALSLDPYLLLDRGARPSAPGVFTVTVHDAPRPRRDPHGAHPILAQ